MKLTPEQIAEREPLIILDSEGFHLRVHDAWHHGLTRDESRRLTVGEFCRLLADGLAHALSIRVARHWVRDHLRPARCKHPRGVCGWKQRFEHDKPKRCITRDGFIQSLKEASIPVIGDDVYCEEVTS
jgi:hypothetical protein